MILSGDEQMDYINANYVDVTVGSDASHYIATQGPLPITTSDFWRMVWEQKCQVVAMVTLDMECGKVKCHRYWPESPELPVKVNQRYDVMLALKGLVSELYEARINLNFIYLPSITTQPPVF